MRLKSEIDVCSSLYICAEIYKFLRRVCGWRVCACVNVVLSAYGLADVCVCDAVFAAGEHGGSSLKWRDSTPHTALACAWCTCLIVARHAGYALQHGWLLPTTLKMNKHTPYTGKHTFFFKFGWSSQFFRFVLDLPFFCHQNGFVGALTVIFLRP